MLAKQKSDKRPVSKICNQLSKLNHKKTTQQKWRRELSKHFTKDNLTSGSQKAHKMLTPPAIREMLVKNHKNEQFTPSQLYLKKGAF